MRKLAAFVTAPLLPALLLLLVSVFYDQTSDNQFILLTAIYVGYPVAILFGVPLDYFVFSHPKHRKFGILVLCTGAVTALLALVLVVLDAFGPFGAQLAVSISFWTYVLLFWMSFLFAAWCFMKIAYGSTT